MEVTPAWLKVHWQLAGLAGLAGLLILLTLLPTPYTHRALLPSEDPKYIRRVFGEHTVGQVFQTKYPLDVFRVLVRAQHPQTTRLLLRDQYGNLVSEVNAALTPTEQWLSFPLSQTLPVGTYHFTISAPDVTEQSQAALIRFQISSTTYEGGAMWVDGKESYGDIAFQLTDRLPLWKWLIRWGQHNQGSVHLLIRALLLTIPIACLCILIPHQKHGWKISLAALMFLTIAIRLPLLWQIHGVYGGDAWNYLLKSRAWVEGEDPFTADARKGPFLPLLLLPGLLTPDPLTWSRLVGIVSAAAVAALTAQFLKRLAVPPSLALAGGLLVAVNREFWWESANALANIPFAALMLAAATGLLHRSPAAVSISSALAALTRFEGIVIPLLLVPAVYALHWKSLARARRSILPAVLILSLLLPTALISGRLGVRSPGDLASDAGLYLARSQEELQINLDRLGTIMNQQWFIPTDAFSRRLSLTFTTATMIGLLLLLVRHPRWTIPILVMLSLETAIVTGILPKSRYLTFLIPFAVIALIYAISHLPRRLNIALASSAVALAAVSAVQHIPDFVEQYNQRGQTDDPTIQAARFLKSRPGQVAMSDPWLPLLAYLPRERVKIMRGNLTLQEWLAKTQPEYIFETNENPIFAPILSQSDRFEVAAAFHAREGSATAIVYQAITP